MLKGDGDASNSMKEEVPSAVTTTTTTINTTYESTKEHSPSTMSLPKEHSAVISSITTTAAAKSVVLDLHANPEVSVSQQSKELFVHFHRNHRLPYFLLFACPFFSFFSFFLFIFLFPSFYFYFLLFFIFRPVAVASRTHCGGNSCPP